MFAFASIEGFITGMRLANETGERKGYLKPITWKEAVKISSSAILFTVSDKSSEFGKGQIVKISENGVRNNWDGRWTEVQLVKKIEDEIVPIGGEPMNSIRKYREAYDNGKGITQQELANKVKMGIMTISRYETASRVPRYDDVVTIAIALGCSPEQLMSDPLTPFALPLLNQERGVR